MHSALKARASATPASSAEHHAAVFKLKIHRRTPMVSADC